ncbi:MAG: hypothetical protein MJZ72_00645 [Bacteroidales bacterium]|nr:hypothetical protein [Bacteroidales bacterium]
MGRVGQCVRFGAVQEAGVQRLVIAHVGDGAVGLGRVHGDVVNWEGLHFHNSRGEFHPFAIRGVEGVDHVGPEVIRGVFGEVIGGKGVFFLL